MNDLLNSPAFLEKMMRRAMQLALKAQYRTEPNPIVGAVLVDKVGEILAEGYHKKAGTPHAEVNALQSYEVVPPDSTLFVTLEPCSHYGKTPPCAELLIRKKVSTVVVGTLDPNPLVAGRGIQMLRDAGITVKIGVCEEECRQMNRVFNTHITQKRSFVTLKAAATLDGKIAMPSGESQWITGAPARELGHRLRSQHQAIAVGRQTLLVDNPRLTDRVSENPRQPVQVVFTTEGDIPETLSFYQNQQARRIVVAGSGILPERRERLENNGIKLLLADTTVPDLEWVLSELYREGICSVLLEGGAEITGRFIRAQLVDQVYLFLAGKIIGSQKAPGWTGELQFEKLGDVPQLDFQRVEMIGKDILLVGNFRRS